MLSLGKVYKYREAGENMFQLNGSSVKLSNFYITRVSQT